MRAINILTKAKSVTLLFNINPTQQCNTVANNKKIDVQFKLASDEL